LRIFLRTLIQYWYGRLIAVIVSGCDGDSPAALCGIKEVGGIDFILSPEDIGKEISRISASEAIKLIY
jgi:two-component system, chemotaxis family, protein-glutamate methylesterase/glutaminase